MKSKKQLEREKIEEDTRVFLRNGGKIEVIPYGETARDKVIGKMKPGKMTIIRKREEEK